jgi:glycosyltransferase involved in cell wall biosynthesis
VTNPPFLPLAGFFLSLLRGQRYVCLIHDVYPDIAVRLGYFRPGGVVERLWRRMNRAVWKRASAIVVVGRDMQGLIAAKLDPADRGRIRFIPNWADGEAIVPLRREDNPFLAEAGIAPGEFVVQYSGNMGLFHDMETIVSAAALLRDLPVRFLFIGGGGKREKVAAMARDLGLANVTFLPYQPKEKLPFSLCAADVSLVCLEKGVEGMAVPSKFYGILASGRPVIALMDERSEIGMSIRESGCGRVLPQGDPRALAEAIRALFGDREAAAEMGRKARAAFDAAYTRKAVSRAYLDLLKEVAP